VCLIETYGIFYGLFFISHGGILRVFAIKNVINQIRNYKKNNFNRYLQHWIINKAEQIDFVSIIRWLAYLPEGRPWLKRFEQKLPVSPKQTLLLEKAIELTLTQLANDGQPADPAEIRVCAQDISCRYNQSIHRLGAAGINALMAQLFDHHDYMRPFISRNCRELIYLDELKKYRKQGLGVIYLINHSSHVDEFVANCVFHNEGLGLPLFAAGTNMMKIKSLARLFMIGSYTVQRKGSSRSYLATLYNFCRAISMTGEQQGIFLEAWAGGARSRDGSLRYPRRLVTLRGAIDIKDEVVVQPVAISYAVVPEDLFLAARAGISCWIASLELKKLLGQLIPHPKVGLWRACKGLNGRAYLVMPQPLLLSELRIKHIKARSDLSLDEFIALTAIKNIAASKVIMASQLTARVLLRARRERRLDLGTVMASELKELKEYHQITFGHQPDLEDFIDDHSLGTVLNDGLNTLFKRKIIAYSAINSINLRGLPQIVNEKGLSFYATHGDRRLYSPQARENIVVIGDNDWDFAFAYLVGNRILDNKRYLHHSLTLFEPRSEVAERMGVLRIPSGFFKKYRLPKNVFVTSDPKSAFKKASEIILAVSPDRLAMQVAQMLEYAEQSLRVIIVNCGFDPETKMLPCEIITAEIYKIGRQDIQVYVLMGAVSAEDLVFLRPVKIVLAGPVDEIKNLANLFCWPPIEIITSDDVLGVQLAGILAKIYSLWGGYLQQIGRIVSPTQIGYYLVEASAEARSLALVLGGMDETFSAASHAWTATFVILGLSSESLRFGRCLGRESRKSRDFFVVAQRVLKQQEKRTGSKIFAYYDLRLVANVASKRGLSLPILEEAYYTLWGIRSEEFY